jgi:hypothetical protein
MRWSLALTSLLYLATAGCHSWHTALVTPETLLATQPARVRITRTNGSQVSIDHPAMRADTIVGTLHASSYHQPVAISLADVRGVATLRPDAGKTVLLIGTLGVLFYIKSRFNRATFE